MVGRPASENHDTAEVPELLVAEAEALEDEVPVPHPVAERLLDRVRLLVDLLEHERLVAGFLRGLVVPVDLDRLARDLATLDVEEARALGGNRHDLAVVDQLDPPRLAEEGDGGGGKEHLPVAGADEQRALLTRANELAGMVVVDDGEREVPFELLVGGENGLAEVAAVVALDEVRDDLGVGLGPEDVPLRFERLLQLTEVLDDPVQHDRKLLLVATDEWMRVLLGDTAVRRPARVPETGRGLGAVGTGDLLQSLEIADGPDIVEAVLLEQREPGGVVASILEALEAAEEKTFRLPPADVSDDPAHPTFSLRSTRSCGEASIEGVIRTPP